MAVLLETSIGDITIDLLTEERPKCCKNFLKLCKIKYYNFCLFHSVQRNLVAQTGDPTGSGREGESVYGIVYGEQAKYFDMEITPRLKHRKVGTVSMVNNGHNMHGSQFFITLGENLDYLDNTHTVFGEVAEGFDVLKKLNEAFCDKEHRPYKDIRIYHTIILDDPFDDPPGLEVPDRSPEPTKQQLDSGRIGADEEIDEFKGMSEQEVQELMEEREAKANAQILAMVGDLPDEDVAPPENVLFVCKLNPVTTDEDLEVIFSRFGDIKSCEVIRDQKTQESLQYAFIEFDNPQSCENAYFKMDNVLIDDRRIHVDFSQSVSKIKYKGKGRVEFAKDFQKEEDSFASKFRVKDNTRRDNKYDLVFEDDDDSDRQKKKKKKKKHKHKGRESDSEEETRPLKLKKKYKTRDSSSPDERRRRSPSPEIRSRRSPSPNVRRRRSPSPNVRRRRSPSPMGHKSSKKHSKRDSKSRSPVRRKQRSRSKDRRSRSPARRSRSRDRYSKDKYRDKERKYR
ncbi:peptidyl-prolyl cis-trans isomerase-like 4 isoform X2 [Ruditapes philippinarum]|uniref:peptidyl-prolyl cis-trans isomerase-like 4 isoform X2 n=1 Tax=Ruditapes philippinarum TaxID=129788 RepID=UPI00295A7EEE|nr:peptidyl-prolyl cis-trans isomerase-like 4 isoform X2 [Ruditapes philippinarum]